MILQLIVYSKSHRFPHKMHRSRRMGSTCRSFKQELLSKVWFWFAKLILKRSGSFFQGRCSTITGTSSIDLTAMSSNQAEEPILHLVHDCMFHMSQVKMSELIWCLNVLCFFRRSLIQNYFPHKMYRKRIDLVLRCNKLPQLMVDSK